jgi:endoglucanase
LNDLIGILTEAYGPSGSEARVREIISTEVLPFADSIRTDALGNLIAVKKGTGGGAGSKKVMLAAHMDEIGLMVTHVDEKGFLRFGGIGGIDPLTLLGGRVVFGNGTRGAIGSERRDSPTEAVSMEKLFIDVGAKDKATAERLVAIGDVCCFDRPCVALGERLVGKAMDDRIGCAVLVATLKGLLTTPHDVSFVFTVQEEVGLRGAITSAYGIAPDVAIALDVTLTGDTPEARTMAVGLGKGPAIKVKDRGMLAHAGLKSLLVGVARAQGIPYQLEVLEAGTTDAMAMQMTREGVPAGVISIPTRYVHTPSEMVDLADVAHAVKLLTATLTGPLDL